MEGTNTPTATATTSTNSYPPPFMVNQQQQSHGRSSHASAGPVIGVLAVITVLGILAVLIGRFCSGRSLFGGPHLDMEAWVESKCSTCLDGHVAPAPSRVSEWRANGSVLNPITVPIPVSRQQHQVEDDTDSMSTDEEPQLGPPRQLHHEPQLEPPRQLHHEPQIGPPRQLHQDDEAQQQEQVAHNDREAQVQPAPPQDHQSRHSVSHES